MAEILRKNIIIDVETDLKDFRKKDKEVKGRLKGLGSSIKTTAAAFAGMFAAQGAIALIGSIRSITSETIKLADAQLKTEAKLLQALKGRQGIQQRLIKQASELQQQTLFGDEQTIEAQARLATVLGANEEAIKSLIPLVQDFATAKSLDLSAAAELVGKSVGSSTNALTRYGIQIEGAVGSSERLESAIKGLTSQVGGQAKAAFESGSGAVQAYENTVGDLQEAIGVLLLPTVNKLAKGLTSIVKGLIDFINPAQSATESVEDLQAQFNLEVEILKDGNISQDERNRLIDVLNTKYKEYLPNLISEKATTEELAAAQRSANQAFREKILFIALEEQLQEVLKESVQAVKDADAAEAARIATIQKVSQLQDVPQSIQNLAQSQVDFFATTRDANLEFAESVNERQQEVRDRFIGFAESIGSSLDDIIKRFSTTDISKPIKEIREVAEEAEPQIDILARRLSELADLPDGIPLLDEGQFEDAVAGLEELRANFEAIFEPGEGSTFLERLIEDLGDPKVGEAFETVKSSIFEILDAQRVVTEEQIKLQEERVSEFRKIAEEGSAEQLQLEEERLNDLLAKREQAAQRQKAIAAIEIATNTASSISSGIKAIIDGFAKGGLIVGIAQSIALAATVVSGVIGIKNAISGIPAFAEGTEYLDGPGTHKSDSILIRASKGERIVPADVNARLGGISNDDLPLVASMMSGSPNVKPGSVGSPSYNSNLVSRLIREQKKTNELLQGLGMSVEFNEKGLYARFMKNVQDQSRKNSVIA